MSNQQSIGQAGGLQKVLFKSAADKSALEKARSLFPGMGFAAGYKISQRILKFGGQPIVKDHLNGTWKSLDLKPPQIVQQGLAGSVVGALEVFLLPLDVLKIKMQVCSVQPNVLGSARTGHCRSKAQHAPDECVDNGRSRPDRDSEAREDCHTIRRVGVDACTEHSWLVRFVRGLVVRQANDLRA
jgi:hypothetical protein